MKVLFVISIGLVVSAVDCKGKETVKVRKFQTNTKDVSLSTYGFGVYFDNYNPFSKVEIYKNGNRFYNRINTKTEKCEYLVQSQII